MMSQPVVKIHDVDSVRVLTIHRPEALNALNAEVIASLHRELQAVEEDSRIRVAIVTGSGSKAFAAGADIKELTSLTPLAAQRLSQRGQALMNYIESMSVPVIAAVNGFAFGGGMELMLACDFAYAAEGAKLGLVETNLGLIPGYGGVSRLMRQVGEASAREALLAARQYTADEARELGLVNRVVPGDQLLEETLKTAKEICQKSPESIRLLRSLFESLRGCDQATATKLEENSFAMIFSDPNAQEGISAFLEKRPPKFRSGN